LLLGSRRLLKTAQAPEIIDTGNGSSSNKVAGELAACYFDKGYNCSQSVLLSASEALEIDMPAEMIKGMAAFTGGVGFSGCICGALVGATTLIGSVTADDTRPRRSKKTLDLSGKFHDIFKDNFKTTCCRSLRKGADLKDKAADKRCKEITIITAELLVDLLANEK